MNLSSLELVSSSQELIRMPAASCADISAAFRILARRLSMTTGGEISAALDSSYKGFGPLVHTSRSTCSSCILGTRVMVVLVEISGSRVISLWKLSRTDLFPKENESCEFALVSEMPKELSFGGGMASKAV